MNLSTRKLTKFQRDVRSRLGDIHLRCLSMLEGTWPEEMQEDMAVKFIPSDVSRKGKTRFVILEIK